MSGWYTGGDDYEGFTVLDYSKFRIGTKYGSEEGFKVTETGTVGDLQDYKYKVQHYGSANLLEFTVVCERLDDPHQIMDLVDWDHVREKFRDSFDKDLKRITTSRMQLT